MDGFLYVLDKYFCISRLVPARAKSPGPTLQTRGASTTAPVRVANWEANRNAGEDDGRPLTSEQAPPDDCGNQPCVDEDPPEGGQLLLPVRIADVFSTLFRTDRPVFSQLLTGCNQVSPDCRYRCNGHSEELSRVFQKCRDATVESFCV